MLVYANLTFTCLHCRVPICRISSSVLVGRSSGGDAGGTLSTVRSFNVLSVADGFSGRLRVLGSEALVGGIISHLGLCAGVTVRRSFNCSIPLCGGSPLSIFVATRRTSGLRKGVQLRLVCSPANRLAIATFCVRGKSGRRAAGSFSRLPTVLPLPMNIVAVSRGSSLPTPRRPIGLGTVVDAPATMTTNCETNLAMTPVSGADAVTAVDMRGARVRQTSSFARRLVVLCGRSAGARGGRITRGDTSFVRRHVDVVGRRLNAARARLTRFGRHTKLASVDDSTRLTLRRDSGCRRRCTRGTARVGLIGCLHSCVGGPTGGSRVVPTGMKLDSVGLASTVSGCGGLVIRHGHLLHASSRDGPTVVGLGAKVRTVHRGIGAAMGDILGNLRVAQDGVSQRSHGCRDHVDGTPGRRRRFVDVTHRRRVGTALCVVLLRGHRRGTVALTTATGGKHVVRRPVPTNVISPRNGGVCVVTFIVNVNVPLNVVFLLGLLHFHVRKRASIRGLAGIPVVNSVPLANSDGRRRSTVTMHRGSGSVVARAFHDLHAGLLFVVNSPSGGIILVASAVDNRNGAFVTSGLTLDLTLLNGGIVLMKLSVHGPKLGGLFRLSRGRGKVARCLTTPGSASLRTLVRPSNVASGLSLLLNNPVPPGPARLLTHRSLRSAVDALHGRCSCVMLSATPVNVIASALVLSHMTSTDVCIYHTSCARGASCRLVGRLRRRRHLPGLYAMIGKVSVGGGGCNCCCNCNGCKGCCNCNGGCKCD